MAWLHNEEQSWILCLQEPYFSKRGITKIPREYGAFWGNIRAEARDGNMKNPRALIIAPRRFNGYMVTQHSSLDVIVVRFDELKISVISGYFASDKSISTCMCDIIKEIEVSKNVLLCVDSNAYHAAWGSDVNRNRKWSARKRGKELVEMIRENDLLVCNEVPHLATFIRDSVVRDESHIDITMSTSGMFNKIHKWQVVDETYMSDHRSIVFQLSDNDMCMNNEKYEGLMVPWKKPCAKMEGIMEKVLMEQVRIKQRLVTKEDVDEYISEHNEKVLNLLKKVYRKKEKNGKERVFWWTEEVARAYGKLRIARRRMRRYKYDDLKKEFVSSREEFRQIVQKAKLSAWKDFTSEVVDPWSNLIKIVKATTVGRIQSRTLHDINGSYAHTMDDTLLLLGRQFFPQPEPLSDVHRDMEWKVQATLQHAERGPDITLCELRVALGQLSSSTSPGFDLITNNVVKCLARKGDIETQYLKMFNICLHDSYFPTAWKKAKVVLIPKPMNEVNSIKSFRPISLTSTLAKLFERIILARLLHYLTMSNALTMNQHAYQKGKSTQTALHEMYDVVQHALHMGRRSKSICVVVFLDISGAFDKTWHTGILSKLLDYNVPTYLVLWIKNFLCDRTAYLNDCNVQHAVNLSQGCPQGGVLSPILWNVLFNELLALPTYNGKNRYNVLKVIGYADDAAIICKTTSVEEASRLINLHLIKLSNWAKTYRIKFNPSKLAVLTISNRKIKPPPATVYYEGVLVNEVTEYKYLGLVVDNQCTWKSHISSVLHKLSLVTRSLRGLSRANWGISLDIYRMLFHAIFVPVMTYGIAVWGWKATSKTICDKFDREIRAFGLMATRCLKSTSNQYIFALLKTQNFKQILQFHALKTSLLQFHVMDTKRREVYENYCNKRISREVPQSMDHHFFMCRRNVGDELGQYVMNMYDDPNNQYRVHPANWVVTDTAIDQSVYAIWKGSECFGWSLYTDASKSTHGLGWGMSVFWNSFCVFRDSGALKHCSIFAAESYALLQATLYIHGITNLKCNEVVEIRCDAQGVVRALQSEHQTFPTLIKIKDELRKLHQKGVNVKIRWIPGHCNIYGNEVADKLAKKATDDRHQTSIAVTNRELKAFLKRKETVSCTLTWSQFQSRNVKFFLPDVRAVNKFINARPSVALCQIISGHSRLNDFICGKLGVISSPMCECGEDKETITHYLLDCKLYESLRKEIWSDYEASYAYILKDWKLLNDFVIRTGRFSRNVREALLKQSK